MDAIAAVTAEARDDGKRVVALAVRDDNGEPIQMGSGAGYSKGSSDTGDIGVRTTRLVRILAETRGGTNSSAVRPRREKAS